MGEGGERSLRKDQIVETGRPLVSLVFLPKLGKSRLICSMTTFSSAWFRRGLPRSSGFIAS